MRHFVYIAECEDGTYYAGCTIRSRKKNGKVTIEKKSSADGADKKLVRLLRVEAFKTKKDALNRKKEISGFSHKRQESLVS